MNNKDKNGLNKPLLEHGNDSSAEARYKIYNTFLRIKTPLARFISRHLVSANDIDDIAHEAFLRAYEAEKKKPIDEPSAFIFQIAKNLIFSEAKKKSRRITDYIEDFEYEEILKNEDTLEDNIMAQQKLGILCEAVASLPPQCRRVFLLKKVYGMSHQEISEYMGIAISTTEKHLCKAVKDCSKLVSERYSATPHSKNPIAEKKLSNLVKVGLSDG